MNTIKYVKFGDIDPESFISVLNDDDIRNHLITHKLFDTKSIKEWIADKCVCDAMPGCRIRAIYSDDKLVGWCGIQKEEEYYEVAIVISKSVWGIGISIFNDMLCWANELGHREVVIHLLESRPVYKFLKQKAVRTYTTQMLGRNFITYHIAV